VVKCFPKPFYFTILFYAVTLKQNCEVNMKIELYMILISEILRALVLLGLIY